MKLTERFELIAGLALLALLAAGCLVVLLPFMSSILWALILCFSTWPIYTRLLGWLAGRSTLAATLMTLAVALVLVVPLIFLGASLADHVGGVIQVARLLLDEGLPEPPIWLLDVPLVGGDFHDYWADLASSDTGFRIAAEPYLLQARNWALTSGARIGQGAIELTLSVLICFFFYRDGRHVAAQMHSGIRRVAGDRAQHLLDVAGSTIKGVVYGVMGTAFAQGLLAGIGLWMAGVPGALLLGFATFVLSLVPMGPPLIWAPAALWLFYTGDTGWAIFMALWGFLVVSSIDNIIKPWLISRENRLPILLVFLGVIGGLIAFGFIGIFLGPTLLAVGFTLFQQWNSSRLRPVGLADDETADGEF
ncbi:MAG: AI-2E family transporter [Rhodospirillaceae bacterium]|nr:AI-2E family transporter [Rhodospirillaceae bacterium]